jgi:hypothetical protein
MTRYSAPLLIAAMYFMTLPAPALAHGLSSPVATFILSFLALALVAPTLTDFFAIKLQRPRQARSHAHQSHRSRRRDSFVLGVAMAEQRGSNGS